MAVGTDADRRRVIHVTTAHAADDVRIFERECRSLAQSGRYDVLLVATGTIPPESGVTLIPLRPAARSRVIRFSAGPRRAWGITRAVDAELWHYHDPELLPVALAQAMAGRAVVWDAHEDYVQQFRDDGGNKAWVPRPVRGIVRGGMSAMLSAIDRSAAAVVAATPTIAQEYSNRATVVVGNEARLVDFAGCEPTFSARRVLFTGHVGPSQLFPEVVEALSGLPDVVLAVAGREPDPIVWKQATARLGERIAHLGWLDRPRLREEIGRSSLGLCTYADIPTNSDNTPNKIYEFGAAGLPVVATPNPSNARFLHGGAGVRLSTGFSATDLRTAIAAALSDETSWLSTSRRGRVWAKSDGSWAASEARLLDVYARVLSSRSEAGQGAA